MATNTNATNNTTMMIVETITTTIIPAFLTECLGKNKKALKSMCERLSKCDKTKDAITKIITDNFPKPQVKIIKEKKTKAPKDPDAPKRNKSAYIFFCEANRERLKKKYPDLKATEILSKLGKAWSKAKAYNKTTSYEKIALKDKERYKKELAEYEPSEEYNAILLDFEQHPEKYEKKTRGKKKKEVDSNKPKRPVGAFFAFCADNRDKCKEDNPEIKAQDISRLLAGMWKNEIDSDTKQKYIDEAATKMTEWKKKMEIYKPKSKAMRSDQPKKAKSPYQLFCSEMREGVKDDNPDWNGKEITKELSRMWKEEYKSDVKRQEWVEASEADRKEYIQKLSSWVKKQSDSESSDNDVEETTQTKVSDKKEKSAKKIEKTCKKVKNKLKPIVEDEVPEEETAEWEELLSEEELDSESDGEVFTVTEEE